MINLYLVELYNYDYLQKVNEYQELLNIKSEKVKLQKVASYELIKNIFGNVDLFYNQYGKPYLKSKDFFFNISHTKDYLVMATSKDEVGIDIEKIRKISEKKLNLLNQKTSLSQLDNDEFIKEWTIKESYLKLLGIGISIDLLDVAIDYEKGIIKERNNKLAYFRTIKQNDCYITISSFKEEDIIFYNYKI